MGQTSQRDEYQREIDLQVELAVQRPLVQNLINLLTYLLFFGFILAISAALVFVLGYVNGAHFTPEAFVPSTIMTFFGIIITWLLFTLLGKVNQLVKK